MRRFDPAGLGASMRAPETHADDAFWRQERHKGEISGFYDGLAPD